MTRQLLAQSSTRDLFAEFGHPSQSEAGFTVQISILARDRAGLLRDITTILAAEGIYVLAINTRSDRRASTASMMLEVETDSFNRLARALDKLNDLDSVIEAVRHEEQ